MYCKGNVDLCSGVSSDHDKRMTDTERAESFEGTYSCRCPLPSPGVLPVIARCSTRGTSSSREYNSGSCIG